MDDRGRHASSVEVVAGPQPTPVRVETSGSVILREWEPGAYRHCRLCRTCRCDERDGAAPVCYTDALSSESIGGGR